MSFKSRLWRLERTARDAGHGSDDGAAYKRRCELLLQLAESDIERANELLKGIWLVENGYIAEWRRKEDRARPVPWAQMNWDQRATETATKLKAGVDFLYTQPQQPEIPEADIEQLCQRYNQRSKQWREQQHGD